MAVKLEKVSYQDKIKNINYEFEEEKITSVIGASGSGKTLLSYLISGIEKKYDGVITNSYVGKELGYIFQNPEDSFIQNTVREEIAFGLKKYNYKIEELEKRIKDSLKIVGLKEEYLDKNPFELSSGEKSSLSLAITLSLNPKLIIIDEPTIYLDNKKEEQLVKMLKKLKNNYHKTIIILSSDIEFILKVTDNYLILKKGKIISKGNNKELLINCDKIKSSYIEMPKIIEFINTVKKRKNIELENTFDIKELMKDIYRNVN
ncbi:MAG: energy-coupling factor ABC transporter ATP-binding protein [Bacilli bacterium]|nr:energy-coupling factor ABC transporter ATP-binding protein [Bacilli bacterium]